MLLQKLGFVTTFYFTKISIEKRDPFFLVMNFVYVLDKKKRHNVNIMQPLTTLYKYMSHSTKTKLKICFTIFLINKKISAFVEKLFNLD